MDPKSLWKFWSTPASVHRMLFFVSASFLEDFLGSSDSEKAQKVSRS